MQIKIFILTKKYFEPSQVVSSGEGLPLSDPYNEH